VKLAFFDAQFRVPPRDAMVHQRHFAMRVATQDNMVALQVIDLAAILSLDHRQIRHPTRLNRQICLGISVHAPRHPSPFPVTRRCVLRQMNSNIFYDNQGAEFKNLRLKALNYRRKELPRCNVSKPARARNNHDPKTHSPFI
jgi:hypothetical protein